MGNAVGMAEIKSQTTWFDDPAIVEAPEWEPIPETVEVIPEIIGEAPEPIRTHKVDVTEYWMMDHGDDPDIPNDIEEAAVIAGEAFDICPELLISISYEESRHNPNAKNGEYRGNMQCSVRWFGPMLADLGLKADDLYDMDTCTWVAAKYLRELFDKYGDDPAIVMMAYGGDSVNLRHYYKTGEVRGYASRVLQRSAEMERRHGK